MRNEVKVSDLQLAAYLLALGYPLLRSAMDRKRKIFIFGDVPENTLYAYYRGEDSMSARKLFTAYRDLKGLIVQEL